MCGVSQCSISWLCLLTPVSRPRRFFWGAGFKGLGVRSSGFRDLRLRVFGLSVWDLRGGRVKAVQGFFLDVG